MWHWPDVICFSLLPQRPGREGGTFIHAWVDNPSYVGGGGVTFLSNSEKILGFLHQILLFLPKYYLKNGEIWSFLIFGCKVQKMTKQWFSHRISTHGIAGLLRDDVVFDN